MYTKFEESMIGKRVWDEDGDAGVITRQHTEEDDCVWVLWEDYANKGYELWIELENLTFTEPVKPEEITINGKRYKLVPIE